MNHYYIRHIGAEQITKISKLLSETDWDATLHSENINQSYQDFMATLIKALDTHAPITTITNTTIPYKQVIPTAMDDLRAHKVLKEM